MARSIDERLSTLKARRRGEDRVGLLAEDSAALSQYVTKILKNETWENRAADKPHTRYALGAMQEVDGDYTRISMETAERVANQLGKRVGPFDLEFHLQGSVPLNVHIRGVSDVDLLTLISGQFYTYDNYGPRAVVGAYSPTAQTSLAELMRLRAEEEPALQKAFPKATVDKSGSKAIKISGGSLPRTVDVVPSHWYETAAYQRTGQLEDRGVEILDRNAGRTLTNYPFKHIKLVGDRDVLAVGGLKQVIRLCKNVKADSDRKIALSSFDIAAVMYHANVNALRAGAVYQLSILAESQRHLDYLWSHPDEAKLLETPDGTRRILDTPDKFDALLGLSCEMDDLLRAVAAEHSAIVPALLEDARRVVSSILL